MDYSDLHTMYWAAHDPYTPTPSGASTPVGEIPGSPSPYSRYDPFAAYRGGLGQCYAGPGTLGMGYRMGGPYGVEDRWGGAGGLYGGGDGGPRAWDQYSGGAGMGWWL